MASTPQGERLTTNYQALVALLGARLARILIATWATVRTADEETTRRWLAAVVPAVLAAQSRAVALSDAYLSAYSSAEGFPLAAVGLPAQRFTGGRLRGLPIEAVYSRPLLAARRLADERNVTLAAALTAQRHRVVAVARTDVQLAARAARVGWAEAVPQVRGWRRALGAGRHCALCTASSGTIYGSQMLMPVHAHCTCVAEPVLSGEGRQRPTQGAQVNDSPGLRDAALAGEQVARVELHDELGPVLVAVGQKFSRDG